MSELIECSVANGVQTIRIARADKKNALTMAMYEALADAVESSEDDAAIRVRVLFGQPGAFCAGSDFTDFTEARKRGIDTIPPIARLFRAICFSEKPMIAGVDGFAFGIGATLPLNCDLVYATREAVFANPLIDLALLPEAASSLLAPRQMGYQAAFAFIAAGEPFTAETAYRARLVTMLVPHENLEKHVMIMAAKLAAKPPKALAITRKLLRPDPEEVWKRMQLEGDYYREQLDSEEAREAFRSFMDKRSPMAAE